LIEKTIELDDDPLQMLHNLVNDVLPRYEDQGPLEDHPLLKSDTVVQYYQVNDIHIV
jgi:hypothetical protein